MPIEYYEISPIACLQPYVRCFGILQNTAATAVPQSFRIIADGCPGLIFQQVANSFFDHNGAAFPHLYVHGIATTYSHNTTGGQYFSIIVNFRPHALKAFFGIDAHELTNGYTGLDDMVKNDLSEILLAEEGPREKIAILSSFLMAQLIRNKYKPDERAALFIQQAADHQVTLKDVQSLLNISERSLERLVKMNIGLSPRLFARINRFQSALHMLEKQPAVSLTDIAYENNYFDQSHYIREFREFAGAAPGEFLSRAAGPLTNFPAWK